MDKFVTDVLEFVKKTLPFQTVIVYCTEIQAEALAKDFKCVMDDEVLDEILTNLDVKIGDKYPLLLVTKPDLMRAIDYRAPNMGIALLICKSFGNEREA